MECWRTGVMGKNKDDILLLLGIYNTPILHYSKISADKNESNFCRVTVAGRKSPWRQL